jgi:hypothetical protein
LTTVCSWPVAVNSLMTVLVSDVVGQTTVIIFTADRSFTLIKPKLQDSFLLAVFQGSDR